MQIRWTNIVVKCDNYYHVDTYTKLDDIILKILGVMYTFHLCHLLYFWLSMWKKLLTHILLTNTLMIMYIIKKKFKNKIILSIYSWFFSIFNFSNVTENFYSPSINCRMLKYVEKFSLLFLPVQFIVTAKSFFNNFDKTRRVVSTTSLPPTTWNIMH